MHCLMMIDKKTLIISPFDHFRRGQIEAPAFVVDLNTHPLLYEWAVKEFKGFEKTSELIKYE